MRDSDWMDYIESGLSYYRPLPGAVRFHESTAPVKLVYGSSYAGKTLACAVEFARRAFSDGNHIRHMAMVGYDDDHVMGVMWPMLACRGMFRSRCGGPASALIPPEAIQAPSHHDSHVVPLRNGNTIHRFSSRSAISNIPWDAVWIDENLATENGPSMLLNSIASSNGLLLWSMTARHSAHAAAHGIWKRSGDGRHAAFQMTLEENPHITREAKDRFRETIQPQQVSTLYLGEFSEKYAGATYGSV